MKHKIAILGGSLRERMVAEALRDNHFYVATYAVENVGHINVDSPEKCVDGAAALILPVRSNDENARIGGSSPLCPMTISEELLEKMSPHAAVYCGVGSCYLRKIVEKTGRPFFEIMEYDAVAVPNAILTAEGTLAYMMEHSDVALGDLHTAIFGFGRVGEACARLLTSVGCKVSVFCRNERDMQRGRNFGFDMRYYSGISAVLPKTNFLINTVPALVIREKELQFLKKRGKVIDLASLPGGVDFDAAKNCGVKAVTLPGLPGKYAPVSAGRILADFYLHELREWKGGNRL